MSPKLVCNVIIAICSLINEGKSWSVLLKSLAKIAKNSQNLTACLLYYPLLIGTQQRENYAQNL
ncbi:hypothetical protein A1D29_05285 [Pasteurellaceae bacterium Orientalotternb1]|nr:hypothetical protein A1D29_05285 [Pasteurellaceae bacterium Orientalotternb1]